jgi:hypothetical protein
MNTILGILRDGSSLLLLISPEIELVRIQLRHILPETVQQHKSWWRAKYYRVPTGDDAGACCDDPRELSTPGSTARMYVTLSPSSGRPRTPGRFGWI